MIDPGTAILISTGLGAAGGLLKKDHTKQQLLEQAREFNLSQQLAEETARSSTQMDQTKNIGDLQRRIEQAPMRDKALYMLNQRLGMTPQAFQPRDMMNPQSAGTQNPQGGGVDSAALQASMGRYRAPDFSGAGSPGSGGVDPAMYHQMMSRLGYSYGEHGIRDIPIQRSTYSNPWADRPSGPPGPPTNPNGGMTPPGMPNGPMAPPSGAPPPTWGGGGMPGSRGIVAPQPTSGGPPMSERPMPPQSQFLRQTPRRL